MTSERSENNRPKVEFGIKDQKLMLVVFEMFINDQSLDKLEKSPIAFKIKEKLNKIFYEC